jgi:hypothetical protein
MSDNGEIEFFEFVPTDFLNDLQTSIEDLICKFIDNEFSFIKSVKKKEIKSLLLESTKKNLFLFRNFVLKNIIHFPPKFVPERKEVDYIEENHIEPILREYFNMKNNLKDLKIQIKNEKENQKMLKYEKIQLENLLKNENELKETALCLLNLKDKHKRLQDYVRKIPFYSLDDENFKSLLEHRELRSEMLKKELKEMQGSVDVDYLHNLIV